MVLSTLLVPSGTRFRRARNGVGGATLGRIISRFPSGLRQFYGVGCITEGVNWNPVSLAVVIVFLVQLGALTTVALALLTLKGTGVGWVRTKVLPLVAGAQRLMAVGTVLSKSLLTQLQALQRQGKAVRQHFQLVPPPPGMWLHPRNVQQALSLATTLRTRLHRPLAPAKPSKTLRLAERLGLVPPILRKLAPLGKVAKTALQTARRLPR